MNRAQALLICLTATLAVCCAALAVRLEAEKSHSKALIVRNRNLAVEIERSRQGPPRQEPARPPERRDDSAPPATGGRPASMPIPSTRRQQEADLVLASEAADARQTLLIRRDYALLLQRLALPAEQEEELVALLQFHAPRTERLEPKEVLRQIRAQQAERTTAIAAIIGYPRLPLYEDFVSKLADYSQVSQIGMQLEAIGQPISNEQKEAIVEAIVSERQRVPDPSDTKPLKTLDDLDHYLSWMEDYDRRVSEDVSTILSPKQLKQLDEFLAARTRGRQVALKSAIQPHLVTD